VDCGDYLGIRKIITVSLVVFVVGTVVGVSVVDGAVAIAVGGAVVIRGMFNQGAAIFIVAVVGVVFVGVVFIVVAVIDHADVGDRVVVVGSVTIVIDSLLLANSALLLSGLSRS